MDSGGECYILLTRQFLLLVKSVVLLTEKVSKIDSYSSSLKSIFFAGVILLKTRPRKLRLY